MILKTIKMIATLRVSLAVVQPFVSETVILGFFVKEAVILGFVSKGLSLLPLCDKLTVIVVLVSNCSFACGYHQSSYELCSLCSKFCYSAVLSNVLLL